MQNRLADLRDAKGMTQDDLAHALHTTRQQIWRLESGRTPLKVHWLEKLAKALNVDPLEILGAGTESAAPTPMVADIPDLDLDAINFAVRTVLRNHIAEMDGIIEPVHIDGISNRIVQAYSRIKDREARKTS